MFWAPTIASLASLAGLATSQTLASLALEPVVTGEPVPGVYSGALRPQIHYSPPDGFMNDPNGMFVDESGTWHLYYQYNPTGIVAGNQHWGHATSQDLYTWENQAIAIYPGNSDEGIFTGSCVVDVNNTSGFFSNQTNGVVAIYTLNTPEEETQEIAYSTDGGYSFTKYSGNPVLSIGSTQFRDPKVIWYEDHWIMVVAYAQEFTIGIFTSQNLVNWTHASNFSHHGLLGLQYECPNLVTIPMEGSSELMYLLIISINPGAPQGGSISQYFPGTFNGTHFTPVDNAARISDFGKDNYAGQFFYGTPDGTEPVFIAWASNWEYSQIVPTGPLEGWRSAMTLPRKLHLANVTRIGYDLFQQPYDLSPLYSNSSVLATNPNLGNRSVLVDYSTVESGTIYFQCNVSSIPNNTLAQGTLNFTFSSSVSGESVKGGFFFGGDTPFWINRGGITGFDNPFFTDKFSTPNIINSNGTFYLEGVIDRSILEVFLDQGRSSATGTFFPTQQLNRMEIAAAGLNEGVIVSVTAWGLNSTWGAQVTNATVLGNTTAISNSTQTLKKRLFDLD